jgi:ribosomal protein S18 acetylase RimI-like enzyme
MSCWSLDDDAALGAELVARGFEWGWQPHWMARSLARLPRLTTEHEVVRFERGPALPQRGLPYADEHADPRQVRHLAVRDAGIIVGHVVVNTWRGSAGIYSMGVAETHQRRGIGRALTLAGCGLARELGCDYALLNATAEGELLYRSLGFHSLGKGQTWWRHRLGASVARS